MKLHIYHCPPKDYWDGWTEVYYSEAVTAEDLQKAFSVGSMDRMPELGQRLHNGWKGIGWEGDGTLHWAGLPGEEPGIAEVVFSVKQLNNGSTFYASTVPLDYLNDFGHEVVDVGVAPWERT